MPSITSPLTVEAFTENRIKALLEAQLTKIPDANILTGHTIEDEGLDQESPVVIVTATREEEDIPGTGWWITSVEIELDPRDLDDDSIDAVCNKIETAIGDGANDIETQFTNGRLKCMTGSVFYDQSFDYDPSDGERSMFFKFSGSFGILAPS